MGDQRFESPSLRQGVRGCAHNLDVTGRIGGTARAGGLALRQTVASHGCSRDKACRHDFAGPLYAHGATTELTEAAGSRTEMPAAHRSTSAGVLRGAPWRQRRRSLAGSL
jgi:hypothetical protein